VTPQASTRVGLTLVDGDAQDAVLPKYVGMATAMLGWPEPCWFGQNRVITCT